MKPKANSPRGCGLHARIASLTRLTPLAQPAPDKAVRPRFTAIQATESEGRTVLVDFRTVTDISSADLARFMEAMQRVASHGGHLVLFGVREEVQPHLRPRAARPGFPHLSDSRGGSRR